MWTRTCFPVFPITGKEHLGQDLWCTTCFLLKGDHVKSWRGTAIAPPHKQELTKQDAVTASLQSCSCFFSSVWSHAGQWKEVKGWVQQNPGRVVGRKPKCGTLKERAGLLPRASGRSQQVWPLLLSALPSQLQCSHVSRASLYSWAAQASRRMQEAEVQPPFLSWCAASLTLTKNLGWQGNVLLEYQNKISHSSDMENIRCLAFLFSIYV